VDAGSIPAASTIFKELPMAALFDSSNYHNSNTQNSNTQNSNT